MKHLAPPIKIHDQLNPLLWEGLKIKPEVKNSLLKIANHFYKFLEVNSLPMDIVIAGSQVNYNYTQYSDIDLHLIFDFSKIECDEPIEELFDAKRKLWKLQHDIKIYGINVEPYAEDINKLAVSSYYSLIKDQWIKKPVFKEIKYDVAKVNALAEKWNILIDFAIQQQDLSLAKNIKKLLFDYRKAGLKLHGEFGTPNLVFKSLRNSEKLKLLIDLVNQLEDQYLSID